MEERDHSFLYWSATSTNVMFLLLYDRLKNEGQSTDEGVASNFNAHRKGFTPLKKAQVDTKAEITFKSRSRIVLSH